mmetsp:Transcript_34037/g.66500  ORF Transcript_34037/g.66500 Transcript_34037/m.66500 type:complete len:310 (-) Transcript_34037:878-1807(-)
MRSLLLPTCHLRSPGGRRTSRTPFTARSRPRGSRPRRGRSSLCSRWRSGWNKTGGTGRSRSSSFSLLRRKGATLSVCCARSRAPPMLRSGGGRPLRCGRTSQSTSAVLSRRTTTACFTCSRRQRTRVPLSSRRGRRLSRRTRRLRTRSVRSMSRVLQGRSTSTSSRLSSSRSAQGGRVCFARSRTVARRITLGTRRGRSSSSARLTSSTRVCGPLRRRARTRGGSSRQTSCGSSRRARVLRQHSRLRSPSLRPSVSALACSQSSSPRPRMRLLSRAMTSRRRRHGCSSLRRRSFELWRGSGPWMRSSRS